MEELYKKYRPKSLKQVIGQTSAVKVLEEMLGNNALPRSLLLTGPSGVGKSTIARILKKRLDCSDQDFAEINIANSRGIDTAREIMQRMVLAPMNGKCRVWLLDEVQGSTSQFQQSILKMLEDTPKHVYFFLCTTEPNKLLKTILTRCTEIRLASLSPKAIQQVILDVYKKEKITLSEDVLDKIVTVSDGSARKALVLLHQIMGIKDQNEQLEAIQRAESSQAAYQIFQRLIDPRTTWAEISKTIKEVDEEPESLRRLVLACATKFMLSNSKISGRCYLILCAFESHFYDSGKAGLVRACWEVISNK